MTPAGPAPGRAQLVVQLIGGVTVLGAGVGLLVAGEHAVGWALIAAGAGELGVKVTTLAQ